MNNIASRGVSAMLRGQLFTATSLFALIASGAASAQTPSPAGEKMDEVVVTGTQIRGVAPVGAPVISVDSQEIIDSGLNTTADILHDIPQVTSIGANSSTLGSNQNASLNTNKDNAINIRGLGTQATLTLLDGRRTPLGGSTGVLFDPSSIPTIAISAIDVVADGASAIYGSDAVAGVANIMLRKNFEGIESSADYGTGSDYRTTRWNAILGHQWSSGSLMVAGETSYSSALTGSQRSNLFNCNETALGATFGCSAFGVPAGNITVPAKASIAAGVYGLPVSATGTGVTAAQLGAENYNNPGNYVDLLPKNNRNSVVYNIQQELNDSIKVWSEGYYTQNTLSYTLGEFAATGKMTPANPGFIPLGTGITSESVTVGLDNYTGPEVRAGFERAYQLAFGTDITLPHQWAFNFDYEHNYNYDYTQTYGINNSAEATAFACTTPGLCFDPVGNAAGNLNAIDSFIGVTHYNYYQTEDLVNGKFDGPVYKLPGGDIKLAIGGEAHRDNLSVLSYNTAGGATTSVVQTAANFQSSRTVVSGFAETIIPIVGADNEMDFVKRFDIDVAGRYDHYSDVGSTFNPKYSARWKPITDLTIHGDLGTSFRAPTLCDTIANCSGAYQFSNTQFGPGVNVATVLGGNPAVKPETARTWSVGGDYKPSWLSSTDFSVNYYHINYENVISTPAFGVTSALTNPIYAPYVIHNPTQAQLNAIASSPWFVGGNPFPLTQGVVNDIVLGTRSNAAAILTDGLDLTALYDWSDSLGNWVVSLTGTYVLNFNQELVAGSGFINRVGQANYPTHLRGRAKFGWSNDNLAAIVYVNYTGGENVVGQAYASQNTPVSAYTTVDTTLLYKLGKLGFGNGYADNFTLSLSVQNLLNTAPPFALLGNDQDFDSQQASALGRVINFGIRKAF